MSTDSTEGLKVRLSFDGARVAVAGSDLVITGAGDGDGTKFTAASGLGRPVQS